MVSLTLKTMRIILRSVIFLSSIGTGCGLCRPVCTERDCITVNRDRVDFITAEKACRDRNGKLLTIDDETHVSLLDNLRGQLSGNFWIGLRLPTGTCSNLSSPLRGYEWLSSSSNRSFIPSIGTWKHSMQVCFPHCVSLSNDHKWTERLCSDRIDGYLCRTEHYDACQAHEVSVPHVFLSSKGCSTGPCQHECTDLRGGYKCSCYSGYIPDSKDPRQCKMHCDKHRCPKICDGHDMYECYCPEGYIMSSSNLDYTTDFVCEDIDECEVGFCEHNCKNTFGGYKCSCQEGFVLKDEYRCIRADNESFPIPSVGLVKPATNKNTLKTFAPAGDFLWLWIFAAVPMVMLICVVRFCDVQQQKRREQVSTAPLETST